MTRCGACGFENPPAMKFCGGCGQPLEAPGRRPEADRRQITVMFCDLVGSSALSSQLDPEELRELIRRYQDAASGVIRAFDGHVAQHLGDGLLVYFGYPRAHEDDARRAVHAGLGVLAEMDALNARLPEARRLAVRLGIHTGPVVAGEIGAGTTREQLALGAAPNVAARLQGLAAPGTLVISAQTHELLAGAFHCEPLGSHALKGIATPVEVFRVAGTVDTVLGPQFQLPMVGRQAELEALAATLGGVRAGHGAAAMVIGEAGLGKSRLIHAFRERTLTQPCVWYEANCSPYEQVTALRPVAALVRRALAVSEGESLSGHLDAIVAAGLDRAEAVPLLAGLLGLPLPDGYEPLDVSPQRQRERTLEVASSLLLAGASTQPLVVLLEDLHWADPSTVEFMQLLIRKTANRRALVLFTSRPLDPQPLAGFSTVTVRLVPAAADDIERIIQTVAGDRPLAREVVSQIIDKADGVPLFAEELTKTLVESPAIAEGTGGPAPQAGAGGQTIPASLQASLTARLDRLPSGRDVLQLASVIGREFSLDLLSAVSDRRADELVDDLGRLVGLGVLYQSGRAPGAAYVFRHALLQDAAYQMLLKSTRRDYHDRIAAALIARFPEIASSRPELVAQHQTEAGRTAAAIASWLQAGQQAQRQSASLEAVSHFRRGLSLLEDLPASAERDQLELALRTSLGSALVFTQGYTSAEGEATYLRAQELSHRTGDEAQKVWTTIAIWSFRIVRGEMAEATALVRQLMERAAASGDMAFLSRTQMLQAWCEFFQGHFSGSWRHIDEVLHRLESQDEDFLDHVGVDMRAIAHAFGALIQWHLGDLSRSRALSERALQLVRDAGRAFSIATVLNFAGAEVSAFRRDYDDVRRHAAELVSVCERHGFPSWLWGASMWQAWAEAMSDSGSVTSGDIDLPALYQSTKASGQRLALSYFGTLVAQVLMRRGHLAEARAMIDDALKLIEVTGDRMWAAETHRVKAEVIRAAAGDPLAPDVREGIETVLRRAIEIAREQGSRSLELRASVDLGRLLRETGRDAEARDLVAPLAGWFPPGEDAPDVAAARASLEGHQ